MAQIQMLNNLESVGDLVGALAGMSEGLEQPKYIEGLILQAHDKAADAFNVAAVATASAGHLKHVFEFGVPGITPGPPRHHNPMAPDARLWVHQISGVGGNQKIFYNFRPALTPNPRPTTESTGVESKYLRKLSKRKYIFWNRALVMETGMSVEIKAKYGDFLFVPFNNNPPRNVLNTKGFVMWNSRTHGPIKTNPGKATKGTFSAFWLRWWGGIGGEIMESDMRVKVEADTRMAVEAAARRAQANSVKPAAANNINAAAASSQNWMSRLFAAKATGRHAR